MTTEGRTDDLVYARALAHDAAEAVPEIQEIYFVGSRLEGTASAESDFDFLAVMTGRRRRRPGWCQPGCAPAPGFPMSCNGVPVHWCLPRADEVGRHDIERNAVFRATPVLLVYERLLS